MDDHPLISLDPAVMLGKPCVKGTRLTVEHILESLASSKSFEEVLGNYPGLTREGINAALYWAVESVHSELVFPLQLKTELAAGQPA